MTAPNVIDLFAGPGGWDMGARILGIDGIHGYDIDADACATATAAGFIRTQASVTDLDPDSMPRITTAIISPPCPTFSASGKRTGVDDVPLILDAIEALGDAQAGMGADDAYAAVYDRVKDPRSALVVETLRFALRLPHLQVLVCEQVPAVDWIWQNVCAELAMVHDFLSCTVVTIDAADLGVASKRVRSFVVAVRHHHRDFAGLPVTSWWMCGRFEAPQIEVNLSVPAFPRTTMAQALAWPAGERINTRGNRRTSGGNEFSADQQSWCLTEKARSWKRVSDGSPLTSSQAGLLTGFPADFPWQGSRSKQFLQAADVVSPPVAAAVLGTALGLDWEPAVRAYLADLYPAVSDPAGAYQPSLFGEVA